ncbi:brain-specific homeobox protein isoform X2 [Phymastichus coffea]|uniref:brain-specific homeobox protein isoform X2 n=1 Tax=Phymastichus coffea TaxID=108790 RepID=UPI00273BFB1C|nr:brain-specific homeobox protein isoform X2 [Phymastichus coffea]
MLPSAAMLKNLQQSAMAQSPSFLMENLLQSKSPANELTSLTLNWAASLVQARQRECARRPGRSPSPEARGSAAGSPERDGPEAAAAAIERMERLSERLREAADRCADGEPEQPARAVQPGFDFAEQRPFPATQQQQQQQPRQQPPLSEETCSCGDERCAGGLACKTIHDKEKPQLKFSVSAILGGNHDRRPNTDHFQGIPPAALPAFLHNLQNSAGYNIAKPIARPAAYHPHHPGHPAATAQQQHLAPSAHHTLHQLLGCRSPYLSVTTAAGAQPGAGPAAGAPAGFGLPAGGVSLGELAGMGLGFPWAGSARGKPRRGMMRRAVFSDLQRRGLEKRFQLQKYISKPDRKKLAEKLGLKDSQF